MATTNNLTTQQVHAHPLGKLMLIGAGVGLIVISVFLLGVHNAPAAWGKYWMVRPLLITPASGAAGGVCYYLLDFLRCQGGWKKVAAYVLSFIVCIVGLWMGIVLGLVGTMWH
nr:hypothetical protein [uncultured Mucilaginibacter sp.]